MGSSDGGCDTPCSHNGWAAVKVVPGAASSQSRRVAAAVVVQCPIFCWQIKSPEALNAAMLLDEHKIRGGRVSSPRPTPPLHSHQFASSRAREPGLALRVAKPEYCRVWREQAGRVAIAGPVLHCSTVGESASGRRAAVAGGVLNAATLAQDWPRGKAFPTGWQGQAYSGAFNAEFMLVSRKCVCCRCSTVSGLVRAALALHLSSSFGGASFRRRRPCCKMPLSLNQRGSSAPRGNSPR